jgi:hypothetical protein
VTPRDDGFRNHRREHRERNEGDDHKPTSPATSTT